MEDNGKFFCTFFISKDKQCNKMKHQMGNVITYSDRDPYHYHLDNILSCCEGTNWTLKYIGNWNHPKDQKMILFLYNI